jgi:hypothetical protein
MNVRRSVIPLFFFVSAPLFAQPGGGPDQRPFERIEQWKKARLIETLDLKEEQSVRFFARLNEHDNTRRELRKEKGEALDKIERLIRNHAEAKELEKVFPEVLGVDEKIAEESRRFFNSLTDILTPEQQGKLLLFERRFERELRDAMHEIQRRRYRGGEQVE